MLHLVKEGHTEDQHAINKSKKVMTSMMELNITNLTNESNKRRVDISTREDTDTAVIAHTTRRTESVVFIATVQIYVMDNEGQLRICRAMLDPGSQSNIITKNLVKKLKLKSNKVTVSISGINQTQVIAKNFIDIHIKSMHSEFVTELLNNIHYN